MCGAGPVEKVLFPVAVHFKGKGFYATDYGRGSRGGAAKDGDSTSPAKETSSADSGSSADKNAAKGDGGSSSSSAKSD